MARERIVAGRRSKLRAVLTSYLSRRSFSAKLLAQAVLTRGAYLKRTGWLFVLFLCLSAVGAYSFFSGKEWEIRLSEEQIREKLTSSMPVRKEYLLFFRVMLDNPRVALVDGSNRIAGGLDVTLDIGLTSEKIPLGGTLDLSGGVRFDSDTGKFFLTDPVVERLNIQGVPERFTEKVNQVLTKALSEYYLNHPIYTLNAFDVKQGAAKLLLKKVVIESKQLIITLGI